MTDERLNESMWVISRGHHGYPNHLSLDTSHQYASVSLTINGVQYSIHANLPKRQSDFALVLIDALLSEAGLTKQEAAQRLVYLAVGEGPGSFVGIRLGVSLMQGLAEAWSLPLIAVPTLASIAWQWQAHLEANQLIWVCIDARMAQVYSGLYRHIDGALESEMLPSLLTPADLTTLPCQTLLGDVGRYVALGNGFSSYPELAALIAPTRASNIIPDATYFASYIAAHGLATESNLKKVCEKIIVPSYVRNNVAEKSANP